MVFVIFWSSFVSCLFSALIGAYWSQFVSGRCLANSSRRPVSFDAPMKWKKMAGCRHKNSIDKPPKSLGESLALDDNFPESWMHPAQSPRIKDAPIFPSPRPEQKKKEPEAKKNPRQKLHLEPEISLTDVWNPSFAMLGHLERIPFNLRGWMRRRWPAHWRVICYIVDVVDVVSSSTLGNWHGGAESRLISLITRNRRGKFSLLLLLFLLLLVPSVSARLPNRSLN